MKKTIECYDNVDHEDYIKLIFSTTIDNVWAEDIRWLKKFGYIPKNKCILCNSEVSEYQVLCTKCKKSKTEIDSLKLYIKNKKKSQ